MAEPANQRLSRQLKHRTELTLAEVSSAVRRNAWLALSVTVLSVCLAAAFSLSRTRIYEASATLQIDPHAPAPLGRGVEGVVELGAGNYWANVEYYNTQHELIRSLPVAEATVRQLGLHHDPSFFTNTLEAPDDSNISELKPTVAVERAAQLLQRRLAVAPNNESRLVTLHYLDASPQRASRVLDAVIRNYVTHNVNRAVDSTSSAVEWLDEQLESLKAELSESELALHEYKLQKQIASLGLDDQTGILKGEIAQLTTERTSVQARIQAAKARSAQLATIKAGTPDQVPNMELLSTSELNQLRSDYTMGLREKRALTSSGKGEQHPEVLALSARIATTEAAFNAEVENIKEGAARELAALRQEAEGLQGLLQTAEQQALELNLMEIEYRRLRRTKDNNEKLYGLVLERSKEAGLTQMLKVNNIHVLSSASTAEAPVSPRTGLILALGGVGGLVLGLLFAVGRDLLDRTIKSSEELEARLHLTPLGKVPRAAQPPSPSRAQRVRGAAEATMPALLARTNPSSAFAESIRSLRTNLLFMAPDKPFRRILMTSSGARDGKTTLSCALAITMAKTGHRVLLIDCDLRKPQLHTVFPEATVRASLSESLLEPAQLEGVDLSTDEKNLSVLPAGPRPPNPTELLHSQAFRHLLDRLDEQFDLLILDSPPLVVSDAAILSTFVDGTVLVARRGKSHRSDLVQAVRAINTVGGTIVGAVLNDARSGGDGYGYGYGQANADTADAGATGTRS